MVGGERRFLFMLVDHRIRSTINVHSGVHCGPSSAPIEELELHPIAGKPPVGIGAVKAVEGARRGTERHLMSSKFMISLGLVL